MKQVRFGSLGTGETYRLERTDAGYLIKTHGDQHADSLLVWIEDPNLSVSYVEAIRAVATGKRVRKRFHNGNILEYEIRRGALRARNIREPNKWFEIEDFSNEETECWTIVPRERIFQYLTIQQCATRYPNAEWKRTNWNRWEKPEDVIRLLAEVEDIAASNWEVKVIESDDE